MGTESVKGRKRDKRQKLERGGTNTKHKAR